MVISVGMALPLWFQMKWGKFICLLLERGGHKKMLNMTRYMLNTFMEQLMLILFSYWCFTCTYAVLLRWLSAFGTRCPWKCPRSGRITCFCFASIHVYITCFCGLWYLKAFFIRKHNFLHTKGICRICSVIQVRKHFIFLTYCKILFQACIYNSIDASVLLAKVSFRRHLYLLWAICSLELSIFSSSNFFCIILHWVHIG